MMENKENNYKRGEGLMNTVPLEGFTLQKSYRIKNSGECNVLLIDDKGDYNWLNIEDVNKHFEIRKKCPNIPKMDREPEDSDRKKAILKLVELNNKICFQKGNINNINLVLEKRQNELEKVLKEYNEEKDKLNIVFPIAVNIKGVWIVVEEGVPSKLIEIVYT